MLATRLVRTKHIGRVVLAAFSQNLYESIDKRREQDEVVGCDQYQVLETS